MQDPFDLTHCESFARGLSLEHNIKQVDDDVLQGV